MSIAVSADGHRRGAVPDSAARCWWTLCVRELLVAVTVAAACRLTPHLFCLPVLAVSCRIVLICAKRSLYAAFSVLPYGESAHLRYKESTVPHRERPPLAFMFHHPVSSIIIFPKELCVCGTGWFNDINVTLSEQRSEAGGSETKAVICGGCWPAALPGGCGAGVLRKGKYPPLGEKQKYAHQSSHICLNS